MITENGQPGKASAFAFLEVCCRRVSETYGKPNSETWTNSDYVTLSHILFRQTHVRISPNTLKRIFGKIKTDSRYYPQKATRDALAAYIGHPDWDHFVDVQDWEARQTSRRSIALIQPEAPPEPTSSRIQDAGPNRKPARWSWTWLAGLGILGSVLVLWLVRPQPATTEPARLICRNPLGENPHSAVFVLQQAGATESATYTVLFGDGKRETLNASDSLHTHYYERPGRYFAVLQQDGVNVDTATIFLKTKGWTVTANMMHDSSRVYPIEVDGLFTGGKRSVSALQAAHAGIDTNRTFFMEFINSHATAIDGDNFELTAYVKSSPDRAGVRCSQVGLTVWGESSQHMFEVMRPGCAHWINIQNSDILKNGQRDDLSFLGADLRSGGRLTLRVIGKEAVVYIDNREVYKTRYTRPLRRIYGVKIRFAGIGTVNSLSLKDLKTGAVFDGNF